MRGPMFFSFVGIDGCGKGTQAERAQKYLDDAFGTCTIMKYPDRTTPIGKLIDGWLHGNLGLRSTDNPATISDDSTCLAALFLANKIEIQPRLMRLLRRGHVIADRYVPCAIAYGVADGIDQDWLIESHSELVPPDLNILFDIPVEDSFVRRPKGREAYENNIIRLERARINYIKMARANPKKWLVIDGTLHPDLIAMKVADAINWFYQQGV